MIIPSKYTRLLLNKLKLEFVGITQERVNQLLKEYSLKNELSSITCLLAISNEWSKSSFEFTQSAITIIEKDFTDKEMVLPLSLSRVRDVALEFFEQVKSEADYFINDWCNRTNMGSCWNLHDKQMENAKERVSNYLEILFDEYEVRNYKPKDTLTNDVFQISIDQLHHRVVSISQKLFNDGYYRQAILDTYIDLVQAVKEKSNKYDLDNSKLMQNVFSKDNPILVVSNDSDEQLGFMWLFTGAVMGIRNPKAHRLIAQTDRQKTLEWLAFASVLHRILEESELRIFKEGSNIT